MSRRLITAISIVAVGGALAAPAFAAAKPKPFKKTFTYTDPTPDPTYAVSGGACQGRLPQEAPIKVKIPAKGTLKVSIKNTGDWALEIRTSSGTVMSSADGGTPQTQEGTSAKIKKAGTYLIVPCNIGGAPTASGTYEYKPS